MRLISLRTRNVALPLMGMLALAYGFLFLLHLRNFSRERFIAALADRFSGVFYVPLLSLFENTFLKPPFWIAVVVTLCLQRLLPAKPEQKIFSVNMAQDAVWLFYETVLNALVVALYIDYLVRIYDGHFSSLTVTALNQSPGW